MLNNLSKEIIYYSVIPVLILAIFITILLLLGKKKNDNYFKYDYFIKVLMSILLAFIISIMIGYTVWVYERLTNYGTLSNNILYMALLIVLVLSLTLALIILVIKWYKSFKDKEENNQKEKEFQN